MLDLKFVRDNIDLVNTNIKNKNEHSNASDITKLDEKRRNLIQEAENLKNQRNTASKEIAELKSQKQNADAKIAEMKQVSDKIKLLDDDLRAIEDQIQAVLNTIPNMLHTSVPIGKSADDNPVQRIWGDVKMEDKKNHIEIAKELNILDFERGAKVTGAGFAFYVGKGAKLERSLIHLFLALHTTNHGYTELMPPFVVNRNSMYGTGQLPKMAEDMYHCTEDDLFLIPTAEVPLTNFYNGEMLKVEDIPIKICGYSPCFRREAGSYGKDTRGFLRVHQFNKVELVNFSLPENSYERLEGMVGEVENVLKALKLTYRVILLCSGDTSFSSAKTYDLEVWAEGEKQWLECSSCSNFEAFQARRANIRFKRTGDSKPEFVHTLNGSGLATSRIMVALIENYYSDGVLHIPEVLQPFCGFDKIERA
ncbi:MAG: serine--tRNA ligase [Ignavibacteria bacterium]|jgi:seryl-tRNA synthetase|nr:serine--tRNA ligase [Ignavibacteria bacterium]